jgi:hypothetical protein
MREHADQDGSSRLLSAFGGQGDLRPDSWLMRTTDPTW